MRFVAPHRTRLALVATGVMFGLLPVEHVVQISLTLFISVLDVESTGESVLAINILSSSDNFQDGRPMKEYDKTVSTM